MMPTRLVALTAGFTSPIDRESIDAGFVRYPYPDADFAVVGLIATALLHHGRINWWEAAGTLSIFLVLNCNYEVARRRFA